MQFDPNYHVCFVNEEGYSVVWPLHSPALPECGEWALVDMVSRGEAMPPRVTFVRALTPHEINKIRRRYMVWGAKVAGVPWALVQGKSDDFGANGIYDIIEVSTANRSVGV